MAGYKVPTISGSGKISFSDMVSRVIYSVGKTAPFFSYIMSNFKIIETDSIPTAGVDANGNLYINSEWAESLCPESLQKRTALLNGVFIHEIMHVVLKHIERSGIRDQKVSGKNVKEQQLWNIATDIVINNIVLNNGFQLPECGLLPKNNSISLFNGTVTVENISDKTAEDIYNELRNGMNKNIQEGKLEGGNGEGGIEVECEIPSVSNHETWKNKKESQGQGQGEEKDNKGSDSFSGSMKPSPKDWDKVVAEASIYAKSQGKTPAGVDREIHEVHRPKIKWNNELRRETSKAIPSDISYARPNKNYLWMDDMFVPSSTGERIKVLAMIDTSGSMSDKELSSIKSELIGIARSYRNQVEFRVISHDMIVHDDILIMAGKGEKELKALKVHGGGGTDHRPAFEYIREKRYDKATKLIISFTDGYSSFPETVKTRTIFVLTGNACPKDRMPSWGRTISID